MDQRSRLERAEAWLNTGPIGHLAGALAEWAVLGAHYVWARARGRDPW